MKIILISAFYSEGMGYSENSLPKALASLGHEVHVVTSIFNVYGTSPEYRETYESFLGPANQGVTTFDSVGYTVHRLASKNIAGYVYIKGLYSKIKELSPDVVQVTEIASFNAFKLALIKPLFRFKLYSETHQHMSVIRPYMKNPKGGWAKKLIYKLTRTLPSFLASLSIEKCYAIAPDCAEVAHKYYGVPKSKIKLQPLGTDTILFSPVKSEYGLKQRESIRERMGYKENDIVCIYTGRFSEDKNPLILAQAIEKLAKNGLPYYGLFIGEGFQKEMIEECKNVKTVAFMKHVDLANYYRAADIGVWPMQESMSMLDAASCGLPLVVTDRIGELNRIEGNGKVYLEGDLRNLITTLKTFMNKEDRVKFGQHGTEKMVNHYSWINVAKSMERDYLNQL